VLQFRVIGPDGEVHDCPRDHPWFAALQLHLGCLGVITAVTLSTVPSRLYSCIKRTTDFGSACHDFVSWNREHPFCKAWWFLHSDEVHVWMVREATGVEAELHRGGDGGLVLLSRTDQSLNDTVAHTIDQMRHD